MKRSAGLSSRRRHLAGPGRRRGGGGQGRPGGCVPTPAQRFPYLERT